jgi:hypothetical protein
MKVVVKNQEDWLGIAALGGPVVDPMILRCGEIFLRGAGGVQHQAEAWDFLTRNIHALSTFFDRIVLDTKIPVFNYADTFDAGQDFDKRTLSQVNVKDEILIDVAVDYGAYQTVKAAAIVELEKLYSGQTPRISVSDANSILGELSASGYAWYPHLGNLALPDGAEQRLASYILGGLIFGAYAQQAGSDHLMQPKRSRLFLAVSLDQSAARTGEEHLFRRLGELAGTQVEELPYSPTFFPLLLSRASGPAELLTLALELRASGEARDYRAWLHAALTDFTTNGRISQSRIREVAKIAEAIERKKTGLPLPKVDLKVSVADVAAAKVPGSLDFTAPAKALWGWMIEQLPSKRHRKLLSRAVIADAEYVKLDHRVRTVWSGMGLPV